MNHKVRGESKKILCAIELITRKNSFTFAFQIANITWY